MSLDGPHSLSLLQRLRRGQSPRALLTELLRFTGVGAVAFVVDVGLFNLLRFGPGGLLADRPLTAKTLAVLAAMLTAWLGHRLWTFSRTRRQRRGSELALFVAVNLAAMGIAVGCLAVSHYLLGFTSALADNISANGVGLVLGTAFRYVCYRYLVFTGSQPGELSASATTTTTTDGDESAMRQDDVGVE